MSTITMFSMPDCPGEGRPRAGAALPAAAAAATARRPPGAASPPAAAAPGAAAPAAGGTAGGAGSAGGGGTSGGGGAAGGIDAGPTPGVTDTSIKIGYLLPLTGAAPVPSNFDKGANVYWSYVNKQGGINGRKVQIVIEDTQSSASVGKDKAKKLIENDKVFMIIVLDRLENQQALGDYLD